MSLVLPNAAELRKVSEEARDFKKAAWIESLKQTVVNDAKSGKQMSFIDDPYCGTCAKEIAGIFEPLGYDVSFTRYDASDCSTNFYVKIMW